MAKKAVERRPRSLSDEAFDCLEALFVSTRLAPGARYTIQQLQTESGLSRTPVHDAIKRLSANQLILVSPRSGLRIAPVNLTQERTLLPLRTEMEAIAAGLASERATPQDRMIMRAFIKDLEETEAELSLERFNITDRLLNKAVLVASGEPLLANTLIPLQTLYRRSGWIYHTYLGQDQSMAQMIEDHIGLLRLILSGDASKTQAYVRRMMTGVADTLQKLRKEIDPAVLDASLNNFEVTTGLGVRVEA